MELFNQLKHIIDPQTFIQLGLVAIFLIVFAESGLLFGFFLPGDSLLLLAGVAAAAGNFDIQVLAFIIFVAAFLGDQVGYWTGNRFGRRLFKSETSRFLNKEHIARSEAFFAKHGHKTIILARFVPIVRTFAPILAGVGLMPYRVFVIYNLVGALIWGVGLPYVGYFLGTSIPHLDRYIHYIVVIVILVSLIPVIAHFTSLPRQKPDQT